MRRAAVGSTRRWHSKHTKGLSDKHLDLENEFSSWGKPLGWGVDWDAPPPIIPTPGEPLLPPSEQKALEERRKRQATLLEASPSGVADVSPSPPPPDPRAAGELAAQEEAGDAILDAAASREKYLKEKWLSDPWPYPGIAMEHEVPEGHVHRTFGIFDEPQVINTDQTAHFPNSWIKERRPEFLRQQLMAPKRDTELYTSTDTPKHLADDDEAPLSWVVKTMLTKETYENALGEQLFRSQDLDRLSTELYPVGYGLPPNTTALIMEDEETKDRFYHICGGRSDHKTFVEGRCVTLRADVELMQHVLHYFGEFYGIVRIMEKYHHKYRGMCVWGQGFDDEDEEFMNGFFDATGLAMRVDEDRMDEACEGYVPVIFADEGTVPGAAAGGHWKPGATGVFIWQNYMQSYVDKTQQDIAEPYVKKWWRDPYLLRPFTNQINHRAYNGAVMPNDDPAFSAKWGSDGLRALRIKGKLEQTQEKVFDQPVNHLEKHIGGSKHAKIKDWYHHGFAHPMFTVSDSEPNE